MKYSDNTVIQEFIEQLVDALKYENECKESYDEKFNIPFLISALWQDLMDRSKCYDGFCSDLKDCDNYDIVIENCDYYICKTNVIIYNGIKDMYGDSWGYIEGNSDMKLYSVMMNVIGGYCKCKPNDLGYREDKHCCGHGCDWEAPTIEVRKSFLVSNHSWSGDEHDYWEFEDEFYLDDKEENEKKLVAEREYKIKSLKETIKNAQRELKELENL